jgi:DNA repair protein RadC
MDRGGEGMMEQETTMTYDVISVRKRKAVVIKHPDDVYAAVRRYAKHEQEYFLVVTLNVSHEIIGVHISTIGLVSKTIVHPREVFKHAIRDNAACVIVCHNHPSDNLEPSEEDKDTTLMLADAAKVMGIHLLDHMIISRKGYFSLKQAGYIADVEQGPKY